MIDYEKEWYKSNKQIAQLEADLKTAHEMIRELREALELAPRFWSKVNITSKCWDWTGSTSPNGYGKFSIKNRPHNAHRVAYEMAKGKIDNGLWIDHICMNRKCVNPSHLRAVTPIVSATENTNGTAAKNKLKTQCPKGHPYSGSNLKIGSKGERKCWTCEKEYKRARAVLEKWKGKLNENT